MAVMNNSAVNTVYKYLFKSLLSVLLDLYPEVKLLDPMCFTEQNPWTAGREAPWKGRGRGFWKQQAQGSFPHSPQTPLGGIQRLPDSLMTQALSLPSLIHLVPALGGRGMRLIVPSGQTRMRLREGGLLSQLR